MKNDVTRRIAVARGLQKADLVLRGGSVVNVFSGEIYRTDVAISGGRIAGLGSYAGRREINVSSKFILPGFIDSHAHIESSMLTPARYARAVLPQGTTAVVADPHEIANVLGKKGIAAMLSASEGLPVDFYFMLSSCVPASRLETSGARLAAADLLPFLKHGRVLGLGEMMDYPGVLRAEPGVVRKLEAFRDRVVDGHAPGLSGRDLSAYAAAGISSEHECTTADEARQKVRAGMTVYVREGSVARDLEALLPAITPENARFFTLATDDLHPGDLEQGSIVHLARKAIRLGLAPLTAIRMATINAAHRFGLRRTGATLPGYGADLIVVDDPTRLNVELVFKDGRLAAAGGKCKARIGETAHLFGRGTVRTGHVSAQGLRVKAGTGPARVIELIPNRIETKASLLQAAAESGLVVSDPERDVLKLVVIERHRATGNRGVGLVRGLGLRRGAIAATVAHDSHNIIACGVDDDDILAAVMRIRTLQGGLAAVKDGKVLAEVALPVAGLMSDKPLPVVVKAMAALNAAVKALGSPVAHPFGVLSFLALPVIPELKLTDRGLVDVTRAAFVDLFP